MIRYMSLILILIFLCAGSKSYSEVLDIPNIQQQESNWCWAGCSESILLYYGVNFSQYEIAAYGTEGANTWNWLWGESQNPTRRGIDMILEHFGEIDTYGEDNFLSLNQINYEIDNLRPFVIRFEWNNGNGHFLVGKGYYDDMVFAMDPLNGNATYNDYEWFCQSGQHTWTHTLSLETSPTSAEDEIFPEVTKTIIDCYPNPFNSTKADRNQATIIEYQLGKPGYIQIDIYNAKGQVVKSLVKERKDVGTHSVIWNGFDHSMCPVASGVYLLCLSIDNNFISQTKVLLLK